MKRVACIVAAVLCVSFSAPTQAKVDVAGAWDFTVESPQGTNNSEVTLKTQGEKIEGIIKGRRGELPLTGSLSGSGITLTYTISFQGNELKITLSGTADKDAMKGAADFGGLATGSWSAKRRQPGQTAPASQGPSSPTAGVNVTGNWVFTVETEQGSGSPTFSFKQEGEKLTGNYKGTFGEAPVQGTVKGSEIKFSFKINAQGVEGVIEYSGTAEKDSMKGTVKLGDLGSGTWTAKRQ